MKKIVFRLVVTMAVFFGFAYAGQKLPMVTGVYKAVGYSASNQSRFAARISAKVDAQRQLLEQIKGTKIDSETTIENGMMKSDVIVTKINGVLKNAKVVSETYDKSTGTASVTLAIGYNKIVAQVLSDKKILEKLDTNDEKSSNKEIKKIDSIKKQVTDDKIKYDGLIVDVRGLNMEPAMINRVFSNKEIVYDPTKVPQTVIVERGLAAYTIDTNKAKAILETYGSKNPIVVKAINLADKKSDVDIDKTDAKKIVLSDEKSGFLSAAKVVFVLDN